MIRRAFSVPVLRLYLCSETLMTGVSQPCTGLALRLRDFTRGHLNRDFSTACLAARVTGQRGEVEPFVRFNEIDRNSTAPRRVAYTKLVKGFDVARFRVCHPAAEEEVGTLLTDRHYPIPCFFDRAEDSRPKRKEMVNAVETLFSDCVCGATQASNRDVIDQPGRADYGGNDQPHLAMRRFKRFQRRRVDERDIVDARKSGIIEPLPGFLDRR